MIGGTEIMERRTNGGQGRSRWGNVRQEVQQWAQNRYDHNTAPDALAFVDEVP